MFRPEASNNFIGIDNSLFSFTSWFKLELSSEIYSESDYSIIYKLVLPIKKAEK